MKIDDLIRATRLAIGFEACGPRNDKFRCIYCQRIYKTRAGWKRHMLTKRGKLRSRCP